MNLALGVIFWPLDVGAGKVKNRLATLAGARLGSTI
jgi:hypothetical protein